MLIEKKSKLLFIGDSITDCGRNRPVAEGMMFDALGRGYVSITAAMFEAVYPELMISIVNMGISGNTIRDLKERWQSDVEELKPDWLSIMIGINDVWRQFDCPTLPERAVYLDEYKETLEKLVEKTKPSLKGLVLMSPFFIEANLEEPMRKMMDRYTEAVEDIATKYKAIFVNTQKAFDELLKYRHSSAISWDRVHPTQSGHAVLSLAFLKALGFDKSREAFL